MTDRASTALSKSSGAPDPLIGRVISDRFKIHGLIARGGMGKVYRAEQSPLGRVCAIKVLNPSYAGEHDPEFHKRFFLEASVASKLTHPNTVTIFDYGRTDDDIYYMAMEYLEGHTLHRGIREAAHFSEERAAHIARQICRALREAHSLGVIHRDLKPANIFLLEHGDETDFVKVLDFGLVKNVSGDGQGEDLTQAGLFMGSPKYMAPEQIRGDKVDARTDIYALGIILYEMVTGKVPFDRPNSVNILMAHVNEEAPSLRDMNPGVDVSPAFEETIARCMAKDPDRRFRSMDEVLAALKRLGSGAMASSASVTSGEYRALSASSSGAQRFPNGGAGLLGANPTFLSPTATSDRTSIPAPLGMPADSPASAASLSSEPPGPSGSKGMLVAAVVGALGVAGIVGFVVLRRVEPRLTGAPAPTFASAAASAPETLVAARPLAPPLPPPSLAKVRVNTEPDGASVKENGVELCSSTPCDIVYKDADAEPTREHKLTVARAGYRVESRTVRVADSAVTVKMTLAPGPIFRAAPPKDAPAAVPTGYKNDIPY
jgi:eukaryotic-like serine/threonine-protein kinase